MAWKALFTVRAVRVSLRLTASTVTALPSTPGSPASILVSSADNTLVQLSLVLAVTLYLRLSICTEYTLPSATAKATPPLAANAWLAASAVSTSWRAPATTVAVVGPPSIWLLRLPSKVAQVLPTTTVVL